MTASIFTTDRGLCNALQHNAEKIIWIAAIGILYLTDPVAPPLIELCFWKLVGLEGCPGCGLGRGVAHLLHGHFGAAIASHPLSPFALAAIGGRILHRGRVDLMNLESD